MRRAYCIAQEGTLMRDFMRDSARPWPRRADVCMRSMHVGWGMSPTTARDASGARTEGEM